MIIDNSELGTVGNYLKNGTALPGPFDVASIFKTPKAEAEVASASDFAAIQATAEREAQAVEERARKAAVIDSYFKKRGMPLAGYGAKMVDEAEANGLDWRLLPAIALRESSGGKHACNNNPFGWGSCKIGFRSVNEAIETVAWNLGGNNPDTADYYDGDIRDMLGQYNGGAVRNYPKQVLRIMEKLGSS